MSRIQSETTTIKDYYSTLPQSPVEESALEPSRSAKEHPLSQQMESILQNFTAAINEPDISKRAVQLQGGTAQVEQLQMNARQVSGQSGMDMGAILLEINQLLSKMRDAQRDAATQQQQTALKMQETAYKKSNKAIGNNQTASLIKGIAGGIGGVAGVFGGISSTWSGVSKANKVKAMAGKSDKEISEALGQIGSRREGVATLLSAVTPAGAAIGEVSTSGLTSEASALNNQSQREKEVQKLNEGEHDRKESDARDSSQQMRSIQQQMVDLYGKIIAAVRW